jgi:hypothetical protein
MAHVHDILILRWFCIPREDKDTKLLALYQVFSAAAIGIQAGVSPKTFFLLRLSARQHFTLGA